MVGKCAGQRHRGFDRVKTTGSEIAFAPFRDRSAEPNLVWTWPERIGREGHKDLRVWKARTETQRLAVDRLRRTKLVGLGGFEDMPAHVRKNRLQRKNLIEKGRGCDASAEQPEGRASVGLVLLEAGAERAFEGRPIADFAAGADRLRAVGIVERKDLRLRKNVRRAEAGRVAGIAFDLDRPALEGGDERASAIAGKRKRRGIALGEPGDETFRQMHVGKLFERLLGDNRCVGPRTAARQRNGAGRQRLKRGSPRQSLTHQGVARAHR